MLQRHGSAEQEDKKYHTTPLEDLFNRPAVDGELKAEFDISGDFAVDLQRSLLEAEADVVHNPLAIVRDFSVRSDMNKAGMIRGKKEKKDVIKGASKVTGYQMEVKFITGGTDRSFRTRIRACVHLMMTSGRLSLEYSMGMSTGMLQMLQNRYCQKYRTPSPACR